MKRILVLVIALVACERVGPVMVADCEANGAELADRIIECSRAANPMADEEGEDLVRQCEKTMRETICPAVRGFQGGRTLYPMPCRMASTSEEIEVCR